MRGNPTLETIAAPKSEAGASMPPKSSGTALGHDRGHAPVYGTPMRLARSLL